MLTAASLAGFLSFGIALACLCVLLWAPVRGLALDRPNARSLHKVPVPRTGGLALVAGVAGSLAFVGSREQAPLLIALALAAVSFCDDLFGLPTLSRFAAHLAATAAALLFIVPDSNPAVFLFFLLGLAWIANLFNFMDGSDGLAGGMAVAGFGVFAIAAHLDGMVWLATACIAIAAAALAFLLFNFHPARIFMGDVGSIPLGFLAGTLGVSGWQHGVWPLWFPLLVFSPFAVDATLTLAKRLVRREKVWHAHREHYYQRLIRMGSGHRNTALAEYALMAACAAGAMAARQASPAIQIGALAAAAALYAALAVWIDSRWARFSLANAP
ncbi:MAG: glycosyl transferase [Betaproteobacteria bacterium]|nr:glycosyl transferase [Betaproteobacteria bacterium]